MIWPGLGHQCIPVSMVRLVSSTKMGGRMIPHRKMKPLLAVKGGEEPGYIKATSVHYIDKGGEKELVEE